MVVPESVTALARQRVRAATDKIERSISAIRQQRPLEAEEQGRAVSRVAAVLGVSRDTASQVVAYQDPKTLGLPKAAELRAEALQGATVDYIGAAWLDAARLATRAVARITFRDGSPQGTGFLVSDELLLTNNHVIESMDAARGFVAEFNYEKGLNGRPTETVRFELDPDRFFLFGSVETLDFALVAIGKAIDRPRSSFALGNARSVAAIRNIQLGNQSMLSSTLTATSSKSSFEKTASCTAAISSCITWPTPSPARRDRRCLTTSGRSSHCITGAGRTVKSAVPMDAH